MTDIATDIYQAFLRDLDEALPLFGRRRRKITCAKRVFAACDPYARGVIEQFARRDNSSMGRLIRQVIAEVQLKGDFL